MTQHVRKGYRNHRRATWAAVLGVLVTAALVVVLPAVGASGDPIPPPSDPIGRTIGSPKESSLGGSTFSCASISGPHGSQQWQLDNPVVGTTAYTLTATNGRTAKLTLTVSGGGNATNDKYMSFRMVGGRISDVGINGGSKTAHYHYGGTAAAWVDADGWGHSGAGSPGTVNADGSVTGLTVDSDPSDGYSGLHATLDNQGKLYKLSWTTVCWEPVIKIEGYVYRDSNASGTRNTGEAGLGGRTVNFSDGSTATTSSDSASLGHYEAYVPAGTYTLCSTPLSINGDAEVQMEPAPSSSCSGRGGWSQNYTADTDKQNFGFVGGVTGACATSSSSAPLESSLESAGATVVAKFLPVNGDCKVGNSSLVFTTYNQDGGRVAALTPVGTLSGTCNLSDPFNATSHCQIVAQKVTWTISGTSPSPDWNTLKYDDPPYGQAGDPRTMKFCLKDPLDHSGTPDDGVTLKSLGTSSSPNSGYFPSQILPSGETSCLITSTQGPGPSPTRVDQVYSAYDGKIFN